MNFCFGMSANFILSLFSLGLGLCQFATDLPGGIKSVTHDTSTSKPYSKSQTYIAAGTVDEVVAGLNGAIVG